MLLICIWKDNDLYPFRSPELILSNDGDRIAPSHALWKFQGLEFLSVSRMNYSWSLMQKLVFCISKSEDAFVLFNENCFSQWLVIGLCPCCAPSSARCHLFRQIPAFVFLYFENLNRISTWNDFFAVDCWKSFLWRLVSRLRPSGTTAHTCSVVLQGITKSLCVLSVRKCLTLDRKINEVPTCLCTHVFLTLRD